MYIIYRIYRAKDKDLGLSKNKYCSHDVIVTSYNRFNKECIVRTVTSLEKTNDNGVQVFKNHNLDAVRNGDMIVIPRNQINTKVLSGVYKKPIKIKYNKLTPSKSGATAPKQYKKIIKR